MELHDVFYGIDNVARPLLLFSPLKFDFYGLVRLAKRLTEDSYDDLFDYLQQFEKLVNASRAKNLDKSHDPLVERGHYARNCPKPRVRDSKYFMEQMLLAKHDEAGVILTNEQNDFLFVDASRMEEIEELSANICLMARGRIHRQL
ncbi:hypothetical protein Tco_1101630 [Tanacetum coccineum]